MVRAERLMELADLLRGRDTATVETLARELAVSPHTVLRDLATLRRIVIAPLPPGQDRPGPSRGTSDNSSSTH